MVSDSIGGWEHCVLEKNVTLKEVLVNLDNSGLHISIFLNQDQSIYGLVSEGDVRRALIKGTSINSSIIEFINTQPIVIDSDKHDQNEFDDFLNEKKIIAAPIIKNKKFIGIASINEFEDSIENPVFIMAGGFGKRLNPLTNDCPKPMLKIRDKPMLEHIIISLRKQGFKNIYISTHYLSEKISDYFKTGSEFGVAITYIHEESPLGTAGALSLLPKSISKLPLLVINGDVLTTTNYRKMLKHHQRIKADISVATREYTQNIPYGVVEGKDGKINAIVEKPTYKHHINSGIYIINHAIFKDLRVNEKLDMPSLVNINCGKDKNIAIFKIYEYWLDIGSIDDYKKAQTEHS